MNDERPSPPYDPSASPPPLPAPAKKKRTLWWVLGGVVVILGALYTSVLWFAFQELQEAGETFEEQGTAAGPYEQSEPSGPINRRFIDKTAAGGGLIHQAKLDSRIAAVVAPYVAAGYTEDRRLDPAVLAGSGSEVVDLELSADREHVVLAVCDDDCSDLDLTLIDENDNVVDEDYAVDARPMVTVIPAWSGTFHANVEMIECFADDCLYTLAVYSRPAPVEALEVSGSNPKAN
jgi:hypothetical protein